MGNSFWDIGQKFKSMRSLGINEIELQDIIMGVTGIQPNLYIFGLSGNSGLQVPWKIYEDDFALLVSQGIWEPISDDASAVNFRNPKEPIEKRKGYQVFEGCQHEWKEYLGLSGIKQFEYCIKCDKKKGE